MCAFPLAVDFLPDADVDVFTCFRQLLFFGARFRDAKRSECVAEFIGVGVWQRFVGNWAITTRLRQDGKGRRRDCVLRRVGV